jgi:hypothetical protein
MLNAHLDQLDLVLGQQIAGLTALRNWVPRKIDLIRSHKLRELEAFNIREEEQVTRLQQAESQRQVLLGLIAHDLGLDPASPPTLSNLIPLVPSDVSERLNARRETLTGLTRQIQEAQSVADELLRVSLDYVHYSMDIFAELATAIPPTSYGDAGDPSAPAVSSWLVNRQA